MANAKILEGKRIVVTGGTGSLGKAVVKRMLSGELGEPETITVFSRDEAKQHFMRLEFLQEPNATDEIIYKSAREKLRFVLGDVRHFDSVAPAIRNAEVVINAAALKQVPSSEYFPMEAVRTNVLGAENVVRAALSVGSVTSAVVGISTDKACKPVNVMGMTKALQERIFIEANRAGSVSFNCVRYGNVIASRGSIIPLFMERIREKKAISITLESMTRFLLPLERAVDTVFESLVSQDRGVTLVPRIPAARIIDVAKALMTEVEVPIEITGIRPGEKIHEIMISEEEAPRTEAQGDYYAIHPVLPELRKSDLTSDIVAEYSSKDDNIGISEIRELLAASNSEIQHFLNEGIRR
jgi:FlaA1/EpsC-like NDP-sugar epimerase